MKRMKEQTMENSEVLKGDPGKKLENQMSFFKWMKYKGSSKTLRRH